jgi:hypothetical protein
VASRASAIGSYPACDGCMSAIREEPRHLVDLLPEAGLRSAPGLIRAHAAGDRGRKETCGGQPGGITRLSTPARVLLGRPACRGNVLDGRRALNSVRIVHCCGAVW